MSCKRSEIGRWKLTASRTRNTDVSADDYCRREGEVDLDDITFTTVTTSLHSGRLSCPPTVVSDLISQSLSDSTKRGYQSDIEHYRRWGGILPSTPTMIAEYLAVMARSYKPATINRRLAALSKAHEVMGGENPTKTEIVKATMRGIRRTLGVAQRQAQALLRDDLFAVLDRLGSRRKDVRDRALLLVGFATAMRRSELVALDVEDVEFNEKGALVAIRRSKTDQEGRGRKIAVPFGRTRHCPINALNDWLSFAEIETGPIFLAMNKHGDILHRRLTGEAVSQMIKCRVRAAGYDPDAFSGHSLRSGFVTSAAMAGATSYKIRQTTGHRSDAGLTPYLRAADLFDDAAAARVL